jgi:hypothetical protein
MRAYLVILLIGSFSKAQEISCAPYLFYHDNDVIEIIIRPFSVKFEPWVSKMKILGPLLSSDWRSINLKEQTVARLSDFWREGGVERLLGQSFTLQENGEKIWVVFVANDSGRNTHRGIAVLYERERIRCLMTSLPNWLRGTDKILDGYHIESQKISLSDPKAAERALGF